MTRVRAARLAAGEDVLGPATARSARKYGEAMSSIETYVFVDPMLDLRSLPDRAQVLGAELAREVGRGHVLGGRQWTIVAEAMPQDEVLVEAEGDAFLVHLTWTGRAEKSRWPVVKRVGSAEEFEQLVEFRHQRNAR